MKHFLFLRGGGVAAAMLALSISPLQAEVEAGDVKNETGAGDSVLPSVDLSDPEGLARTADEALVAGEWLEAAANYNGLLTIGVKVGVNPKELEPLYFVIGLCLFSEAKYDEALKRLTEYAQKYPDGFRIDQAKLVIARCLRAQKRWAEAIKYYKPLADKPAMRDETLVELAEAYKENQEKNQAITVLETKLATGLESSAEMRAALLLADLYDEKPLKGIAWLKKVAAAPSGPAFVPESNVVAMKLAEALMQGEFFEDALLAFRNIRSKQDLLTALKSRVEGREADIARLTRHVGGTGPGSMQSVQQVQRIKSALAADKAMIAALNSEANYDAVAGYRTGRCLAALKRYREASEMFREVYEYYPKFKDRPSVLYALTFCLYSQVPENPAEDKNKTAETADKLLVEFLQKYGKDRSEAAQVADMRINLANRTKDPARINKVFEEVDTLLKGSQNHSAYQAQRIHAYLNQGKFDKAKELCDKFLSEAAADDPQRPVVKQMAELIPQQKK